MQQVGIDVAQTIYRMPMSLVYADGFQWIAARLPAPLHLGVGLLRARGLSWRSRSALFKLVNGWRTVDWRAPRTQCAADLFASEHAELIERIFQPICLGALNMRLSEASAQFFLNVLQDTLSAPSTNSEFWIPRVGLSDTFPNAALSALERLDVRVHLRTLVTQLSRSKTGWHIHTRTGIHTSRSVVLALPPQRASALLQSTAINTLHATEKILANTACAPITTVYLRYLPGTRLPYPIMALRESVHTQHYGQWVFDRGALHPDTDGVMAVVISGHGPHLEHSQEALAQAVAQQLGAQLRLPQPLAMKTLIDRRATVCAVPGFTRPPIRLPCTGLYLASDAADSRYPSTIEGSVGAGMAAAEAWYADQSNRAAKRH